jgi:hypothetical protein
MAFYSLFWISGLTQVNAEFMIDCTPRKRIGLKTDLRETRAESIYESDFTALRSVLELHQYSGGTPKHIFIIFRFI